MGIVALILVLIVLAPILLIWALNILLPISIPFTLLTWLAGMVIMMLLKPIEIRKGPRVIVVKTEDMDGLL
jgi:hypothetical protein